LEIIKLVLGDYAANCYIIFCNETRQGIVIDPGAEAESIMRVIENNDLKVKYIVLTHGHGDHIGAVSDLKESLDIPVLAHKEEKGLLEDTKKNLSYMMSVGSKEISPDICLNEGDTIEFGSLKASIIHIPGHSPGGICLKINEYLITGDSLFKNSIGRTDLFGGSYEKLIGSIKEKLLNLDDDTIVLPGHGDSSTIGNERLFNEFLQ